MRPTLLALLVLCITPACLSSGGQSGDGDAGGDGDGDTGGDGDGDSGDGDGDSGDGDGDSGDGDGDGDSGDGDGDGDGDSGDGDGDGDSPSGCDALEAAVGAAVDDAAQCEVDTDCEAAFSPLCGSSSQFFDSGCYLFKHVDASLDPLAGAFAACAASCAPACQPADCGCMPPPAAGCVAGACVRR